MRRCVYHAALLILFAASAVAADERAKIIEQTMRPYDGPSAHNVQSIVDPSTLSGKVMCGYQGWFAADGDGLGRGFSHWQGIGGKFEPGNCSIDMWPDVSELDKSERFPTAFRHADGRIAEVFSSFNRATVLRHFQWMFQYGIDGAFVQRFGVEVFRDDGLKHFNTVLASCREGANRYGRTYAVMYDLSLMEAGDMSRLMDDWRLLIDRMSITKDPAYLHHNGKPVVAVWGLGFNDGRKYTLDEGIALMKFLKDDPRYGGNTVMLGVPTYWRTLERDCVKDPKLHELIAMGDIVSPWMVGRYSTPEQAKHLIENVSGKDLAWCKAHGKEFLPVVFPGFSWHNKKPDSPLNQIPRLGGQFLWTQYAALKKIDATMVYQAMFDEVDEGTAIFKCTNDPPVGESRFATYEGLPSDHYLKLVGAATKMIRGEIPVSEKMPANH